MHRLINFIEKLFYKEVEDKGYCYVSDNDIFVIDEVTELINLLNLDLKNEEKLSVRKNKFEQAINIVKENESFNENIELRDQFIAVAEYQMFLDEKGFDNRYKKQVRKLITSEFLKKFHDVKVIREKYFFNPKKVEINFIDNINDLINYLNNEKKESSNFFYRGHSNLEWKATPSIYRNNWIKNEHNMFREIIIRNSEEFMNTKSTFEKLTIMQHYGLPTRLLDITKNPLVALYFACSDSLEKNTPGEILIFNPKPNYIKYFDSDTVSVLSNLAKSERNLKVITDKSKFNNSLEGIKLLHLIKEEKPYFLSQIKPSDLNKTLIVKPINNNERIKRQLGYFFLFGIKNIMNKPSDINSLFFKNNMIPKYFVEESRKSSLMTELESLGISSNTLFPEIENGTEHIKSKY